VGTTIDVTMIASVLMFLKRTLPTLRTRKKIKKCFAKLRKLFYL